MITLDDLIEQKDQLRNLSSREPKTAAGWVRAVPKQSEPEQKEQDFGGITGTLARGAANIASGFEAPLGAGLKGLGAEFKGVGARENGGLYGFLGDILDTAGGWVEDRAHSPERLNALTSQYWNDKKLEEILSDPELRARYLSDPQGLFSDVTYGIGNAGFFALLARMFPAAFAALNCWVTLH